MADMYGTVCSNQFKVKDVQKFKAWFSQYYFGEDVQLYVDTDNSASLGGHEQYPSAYPRIRETEGADEGELMDVELLPFAQELCVHLADGEVFNLVSGGNEKLRYVAFDQLIITQAHPDKPYYNSIRSDDDGETLLALVLAQK